MNASEQDNAAWASTPERSNMLMLRMMSWISLHLGRSAGRVVLHWIAAYFLLFAPESRKQSRCYLQRVFGRPATWIEVYRHFFSFASTIHDRIYLLNQRFDLFEIEVHGDELMREACADGKGVFLIGAHMGSFEVVRALGRRHSGFRVAMAMYEENARKINRMLAAINPEAQHDIVSLGHIDSMLKIDAHLAEGTLVGMLADRSLPGDQMHPVTLLGGSANLSVGPFRMAAILKRPVIFMTGLYLGENRYAIHFAKLADFSCTPREQRQAAIDDAMARYASLLETHCRQAPFNWFNFFNFWQADPATASAH